MTIDVIVADITTLAYDAIVNAANPSLLGGGGVDGAIHRAAGPELLEACRRLPESTPGVRCPTGEARITPGFRLKARHVIHTVGPIWHGGDDDEPRLLAACYRNSVALAQKHALQCIAFPSISCGIYGYPHAAAAAIAVATLTASQATDGAMRITLCAHDHSMGEILQAALSAA